MPNWLEEAEVGRMKVRGKVIVVTGAGSGMGRELTLELLRRGAKVAAVDMRHETVEETKALAGSLASHITTFTLDVTDSGAVAALPDHVLTAFGQVDGVVNNAGIIQPFVHIKDLTAEQAQRVMNVNFWGPFALVKAFLPHLLARPEAHILNVSSMGAYAPVPGQTLYGASKAAVRLFTEGLRSELLETNVGVTVAFPGAVATNITENSGLAVPANASEQASKFTALPAPQAAKIMMDAFEAGKARVTVGKDATMMDRLSRLNPVMAANLIYKQMKSLLG
jgi:NAD(P)-dependent dehydrogenase (short-subunit alcohol dehydrogenase family)